jgi:hypothetical protein
MIQFLCREIPPGIRVCTAGEQVDGTDSGSLWSGRVFTAIVVADGRSIHVDARVCSTETSCSLMGPRWQLFLPSFLDNIQNYQ